MKKEVREEKGFSIRLDFGEILLFLVILIECSGCFANTVKIDSESR